MRISRLKPNRDSQKFLRRKEVFVAQLFSKVSVSTRELLASQLNSKVLFINLDSYLRSQLLTNGLQDAYLEKTDEIRKLSHSAEEAAAVLFLEMCIFEKEIGSLWPLGNEEDIYQVEQFVRISGNLNSWLDQLETWLSSKSLSEITFLGKSYRHERDQVTELISRGRTLIESGNLLDYYNIDFSCVHGDSNDLVWKVVCLLARTRPGTLVKNVQHIHDPVALEHLHTIAYNSITSQRVIIDLFDTKGKISSFFALDLAISIIDKIGQSYDQVPQELRSSGKIRERRKLTLKKLYKRVFEDFFYAGVIGDGAELTRLNECFSFDRLPMNNGSGYYLNAKSEAFKEASFDWLCNNPLRFESLSQVLIENRIGVNFALSMSGEGLRQKMIPPGTRLWDNCIENVAQIFSKQMLSRNERYRQQLSSHYDVRDINTWISFWAGVEIFRGKGSLANIFIPILSNFSQLTSLWKPSAVEHGLENSISYLAAIYLYSLRFAGTLDQSAVKDTLEVFNSVSLNAFSNFGNWEVLMRLLADFATLPEVQGLVENVLLVEGIDPKFLKAIPQSMINVKATWLSRISDLELRYSAYFA